MGMIINCNNLKTNSEPLLEQTKSECSTFWYRGVGFQNKDIWEQPHGWQLHTHPNFMLKSKNGLKIKNQEDTSASEPGLERLANLPNYNFLSKRKTKLSKAAEDNIPNELLKNVELNGIHPTNLRLEY